VFSETICGNPVETVDAGGAPSVSLIKVSSIMIIFLTVHKESLIVRRMCEPRAAHRMSKGNRSVLLQNAEGVGGSSWKQVRTRDQIAAGLCLDTFGEPAIRCAPSVGA